MRKNAIVMLGFAALTMASCGSEPENPSNGTAVSPPAGTAGSVVDETRRPRPVPNPKSHIGYVRRDAPAGPPPPEAVAAMKALDDVRGEIGDERFGKASGVLSCRIMNGPPSGDAKAEFARRAERIREIATSGVDLDEELRNCGRPGRARR